MLQSSLVQSIVTNWYETAQSHARISIADQSGVYSGKIRSRLYQTEGFRCFDWPMDSIRPYINDAMPQDGEATAPMVVEANPAAVTPRNNKGEKTSNPLVAFSSKKSIQLLGGYAVTGPEDATARSHPRVTTLATSYTDLYATLGMLSPNCDQTAVCLICGEVSICHVCIENENGISNPAFTHCLLSSFADSQCWRKGRVHKTFVSLWWRSLHLFPASRMYRSHASWRLGSLRSQSLRG